MQKLFLIATLALSLSILPGCRLLSPSDNFSPEFKQKIDDIQGSQNTVESNLNTIKTQLGQLQQSLELLGDNNQVQQGWMNIKADGMIIGVFAVVTIGMLLFYMWRTDHWKRTSEMLAGQIRAANDPDLTERVMATAWKTKIEKTVYKLVT